MGSLVVAGAVAAVALWQANTPQPQGSHSTTSSGVNLRPQASSSAIKVLSVSELTQNGNHPTDNLGELGNLIDGNPTTFWEGDVYDSPNFGGSGGFGLAMDLGSRHSVHELVVTTSMQGWSAETFTSDTNAQVLSGWGTPTATSLSHRRERHLLARRPEGGLGAVVDDGPGPHTASSNRRAHRSLERALSSGFGLADLYQTKPVPTRSRRLRCPHGARK